MEIKIMFSSSTVPNTQRTLSRFIQGHRRLGRLAKTFTHVSESLENLISQFYIYIYIYLILAKLKGWLVVEGWNRRDEDVIKLLTNIAKHAKMISGPTRAHDTNHRKRGVGMFLIGGAVVPNFWAGNENLRFPAFSLTSQWPLQSRGLENPDQMPL